MKRILTRMGDGTAIWLTEKEMWQELEEGNPGCSRSGEGPLLVRMNFGAFLKYALHRKRLSV